MVSCATVDIPDFYAHITLPASEDGYAISTISHKEKRIPAEVWREASKRGIILLADDWSKLKFTLLKNCLQSRCKQMVGTLDELFIQIDQALKLKGKQNGNKN